jgi:hypothetical protein
VSRAAVGWTLLALAVAGLLVAGFLASFERVEEERDVGYRGEARRNELLAFERLAAALGVQAERSPDPLGLPPVDHAVLALGAHHPPGPVYLEKLLDWIADGGHLVFVPAGDGAGRSLDPLLAELEVALEWPREAAGEAEGETEPTATDETGEEARGTAAEAGGGDCGTDDEEGGGGDPLVGDEAGEATTGDDAGGSRGDDDEAAPPLPAVDLAAAAEAPLRRVEMPCHPILRDLSSAESHLSGRPGAPSLITVPWGDGRVTVLADAGFLENDRLGRLDHALFAWDLVTAAGRPAGLAIVDWRRAVPLSALAGRRGWPLAAAGLALLAAWIALRGARFGPPLPDAAPPRRSLLEHLRASGDFLWRRGQSAELLAACRAALARRVDLVHADWSRRSEADRVRHLARLANLPAGTVAAALDGDAPHPDDFTRTVATLERLRRSL